MRRFGEAVVRGQTYRRRPGAYGVLVREGAVLLTYQAEPEPEYQIPGGGIDPGESPVQALHREVFEETGWRIGPPLRIGIYRRLAYMPEYDRWADKICAVYLARPIRRHGPPSEPGHRAVWAEPGAAVELVDNPGDRFFLAEALKSLGLL